MKLEPVSQIRALERDPREPPAPSPCEDSGKMSLGVGDPTCGTRETREGLTASGQKQTNCGEQGDKRWKSGWAEGNNPQGKTGGGKVSTEQMDSWHTWSRRAGRERQDHGVGEQPGRPSLSTVSSLLLTAALCVSNK